MIISVGYRVKSKNGIIFRRWATKVPKDYLLKGYAINNKRLEALEKRIEVINITKRLETNNENYDSNEVLRVIEGYTSALDLINDYDKNTIHKNNTHLDDRIITYEECKI